MKKLFLGLLAAGAVLAPVAAEAGGNHRHGHHHHGHKHNHCHNHPRQGFSHCHKHRRGSHHPRRNHGGVWIYPQPVYQPAGVHLWFDF